MMVNGMIEQCFGRVFLGETQIHVGEIWLHTREPVDHCLGLWRGEFRTAGFAFHCWTDPGRLILNDGRESRVILKATIPQQEPLLSLQIVIFVGDGKPPTAPP
jgi:hypothetical protein